MKRKTLKIFLSLLVAAALFAVSGCSLLNSTSERSEKESRSTSSGSVNRRGTSSNENSKNPEIDNTPIKVEGTPMYVTGIDKNIALRESDEDSSEVIAQLNLYEEVQVLDDASATCYFVYYEKDDVKGYVKKEFLTKEKSAACQRQSAYISKQTPIYNSKESDHSEIQKLNKNDEIFITAKNSGDYWYVYAKSAKIYGYVNSMDISLSKIEETSSAATSSVKSTPSQSSSSQVTSSKAATSQNVTSVIPQTTTYYTGAGGPPTNYSLYYAKVNSGYLAIRSAKAFDASNELGKMNTGDMVYVVDTSTGLYWYCYSPNCGVYGYVNSDYLVTTNPINNGSTNQSTGYTVWTVGNTGGGVHYLALRNAPSNSSTNEIGKLYDGQVVYVYSYSYTNFTDTYWYVYSPSLGLWGYVNSNYIWSN